ncbi:exodeoxyribonuclease I [Candidatus Saccharibacteria bacterium]|nr:exodeoxyribonuclease I [Candidatus Saccharibacteria bacterium]
MEKTFFFYDLETSGLLARGDRIMQFAGQRTSMNLEPIGEPVNILVKMTDDALPSPSAIKVTGITPQVTLMDGVNEVEFCRYVTEEVFVPETVAVGYNTVRFDDEFMRACLWRNFFDPYEWEWKDGRSRWDILDVVRLTRALRPEGIEWPFTPEGKPTNRLELLTKLNGVKHEHAHDALSDVYATMAVARMIREKQPKLFEFLFKMREKKAVQKLVNLENPQMFVYASGRYANEFNKTTVAFPIAPGRNGNVLVYDLRYDVDDVDMDKTYPIVKELCYNKCPAVAPINVLGQEDDWKRIGLTESQVEENLKKLLEHPEFVEQVRSEHEKRPEFPPAVEPEAALYDGFLNDRDRVKVAAVRNAEPSRLADFQPEFDDERLPELLLHYKGRNYPETMSESEAEAYEKYRTERLQRQAPKFMTELEKIDDDFLKQELLLYMQSL